MPLVRGLAAPSRILPGPTTAPATLHVFHTCEEVLRAKKLTIMVDERVYDGLYRTVRPRRVSRFIEDLVRPHVVREELSDTYAQMAADEAREAEAEQWSDSLLGDVGDERR